MVIERIPAIEALSNEDQRQLLDELWSRLADADTGVACDDPVHALLEERMEEYRQNPGLASPWSEVRERLRKALK